MCSNSIPARLCDVQQRHRSSHTTCLPVILCLPPVAAVLLAAATKHLRFQNADFGQLTSLTLLKVQSLVAAERCLATYQVCRSLQDTLFELTESGGANFAHVSTTARSCVYYSSNTNERLQLEVMSSAYHDSRRLQQSLDLDPEISSGGFRPATARLQSLGNA